ncbi:MAG: hypothetical protein ACI399_00650 [Candidatus Cryptobacteroides sp.]
MEERENVRFRLVSIEDVQLKSDYDGFDFSSLDENKLKFQFKIETILRFSKELITVIPSIRYTYEKRVLLEADAVFNYAVQNMGAAITVDKENQQVNVKADLFPSLLGAAYNSLRGIVYANTGESGLRRYPLPLIEVRTLVEKNGISVEE